ncbi:MAG: UDP-glucose 4-epimerase GalE [Peptoniphilaceae bacterium]|nr:UDP-glucose 4-epimerase GalE [Peptoniphilaceae bacterium]MDY6018258.1 UDP-glucose 4-epimerase GalE [Anaerococcus sp.]
MNILLAGGAGYIGSHTAVELLNSDHDIVVVDNYSNSDPSVIDRIKEITKKDFKSYEADIRDKKNLEKIFKENKIDGVIHFAGLKAVGESTKMPLAYYRNNIDTTLTLLEVMEEFKVNKFIFSSSATVYGEENKVPYGEDMPRGKATSPYGWTKIMMEQILEDAARANTDLSVIILRYFNPIGAHKSHLIGELPSGIPNNLMPYVTQVAIGKLPKLTIYGGDYDTPDGTCRRDYIHVVDLARAHVMAVEYAKDKKGVDIFNVGTGSPYSVLDIVKAFEKANGLKINYEIGDRRAGDLQDSWADVQKIEKVLGFKTQYDLVDMCKDSWEWEKNIKNISL